MLAKNYLYKSLTSMDIGASFVKYIFRIKNELHFKSRIVSYQFSRASHA